MARKNDLSPEDMEMPSFYEDGRADGGDYPSEMPGADDGALPDSVPGSVDAETEAPFLRARKRVSVRRGPLPKKTASRLRFFLLCALVLGAIACAAFALRYYALTSWRFRIESSDQIQISGNQNVPTSQILELFGGDISRNIFLVPLDERKRQLEQIPWIESATIMRYLPNRLAVVVKERIPVALVAMVADDGSESSRIAVIDANGVVMDRPTESASYSFPVLTGFNEAEPLSTRAARMRVYSELVKQLDSGGAHYSQDLSEVDLTDPEDVKITVRESGVLLHLGNSNFADRYRIFSSHIRDWQQQYGSLKAVDLRYEGQWILSPGTDSGAESTVTAQPGADAAAASPTATAQVQAQTAAPPVAPPVQHSVKPTTRAHAPKPTAKAKPPISRKYPAKTNTARAKTANQKQWHWTAD